MSSALVPGTVVDQYVIETTIGAGSMGDVFLGTDENLGRKVALKILSERHRGNKELRARFVREARAVASIAHPNVVQVFTTGSFDDRPYIAMEFLDGEDLGGSVRENGPMTSLQAARAILDAAHGLDAAARAGLIHRDVKPSNLVLLRDGITKVTDFGLVRPVDPGTEPALTALGVVVGTPDYIAPEQARGDAIDERVDIYALGGTLYYLVVGRPPFRKGNPADDKYLKVVARHLREPAPDARVLNKNADGELSKLSRAMMSKKPVDRPGYSELVEQLVTIVARLEGREDSGIRDMPPEPSGSGGSVSPTPFVGGASPRARDLTGAGPTVPLDSQAGEPFEDPEDAAPTKLRIPTAPPMMRPDRAALSDPVIAKPKVSRLLVAVTVLSALIFLIGLVLLLVGPMPEARQPASSPPGDAGPVALVSDAAPSLPAPPSGMIVVRKSDGSVFFADRTPVSFAAYRAVVAKHRRPKKLKPQSPVTRVSYSKASALARKQNKRLLRSDEWDAAAKNADFVGAGTLWEWVDSGVATRKGKHTVRGASGRTGVRKNAPFRDVTFRLARDL